MHCLCQPALFSRQGQQCSPSGDNEENAEQETMAGRVRLGLHICLPRLLVQSVHILTTSNSQKLHPSNQNPQTTNNHAPPLHLDVRTLPRPLHRRRPPQHHNPPTRARKLLRTDPNRRRRPAPHWHTPPHQFLQALSRLHHDGRLCLPAESQSTKVPSRARLLVHQVQDELPESGGPASVA